MLIFNLFFLVEMQMIDTDGNPERFGLLPHRIRNQIMLLYSLILIKLLINSQLLNCPLNHLFLLLFIFIL